RIEGAVRARAERVGDDLAPLEAGDEIGEVARGQAREGERAGVVAERERLLPLGGWQRRGQTEHAVRARVEERGAARELGALPELEGADGVAPDERAARAGEPGGRRGGSAGGLVVRVGQRRQLLLAGGDERVDEHGDVEAVQRAAAREAVEDAAGLAPEP